MRQASKRIPDSAEKTVRDIRRATRRHHSAEEKIRIVLEGLRGENSILSLSYVLHSRQKFLNRVGDSSV
jgi:transposase-like protein